MRNKTTILSGSGLDAVLRAIAHFRGVAFSDSVAEPGEIQISPYIEPRRMTLAEQWNRLAAIIKTAVSRADEATRCQAAAAVQLDLAQYGLTTLVDELSAVMDMQGRRRRATVHVLDVTPPRVLDDAIAA
jgi:hypothetical protein